jgi:squalene-hopene/tetraprenyl-beta-curcumene cyclase
MHAKIMKARPLTRVLQRIAEPRALRFLDETQGANGAYEESAILTANVYIGLRTANVGHEIAQRCLDWLLATRRPDGSWPIDRDLELSATTYVLGGLEATGNLADPRLQRTAHWIAAQQMNEPWDPTGAPAGGWAWAQPSGWPDSDDTACAALALARLGQPEHGAAIRRGCDWLLEMQNSDGSWGGFLRNGKMSMDQPCAALTAHAVMALAEAGGYGRRDRCIRRALQFFARTQTADGAIPNLWFRNHTCGTAWALSAYASLGIAHDPVAARAAAWLFRNQNSDGGWGGARDVPSTVEETAWALTALSASGVPSRHPRLQSAADWLLARQKADGTWDPSVICFYCTQLRYSSDHMANGFALEALGRFQKGQSQ